MGFCVMLSFAEVNFQTDYDIFFEITFGGDSCYMKTSWLVVVANWLTGFCMVWVSTERVFLTKFLIFLISFIYLYCYWFFWSCGRNLCTTTLEQFSIFIIIIIVIIIVINIIISVTYHFFWVLLLLLIFSWWISLPLICTRTIIIAQGFYLIHTAFFMLLYDFFL